MEAGKLAQVLRKVVLPGILMALLLSRGNALLCKECVSTTAPTCTGPSQTCTFPANTCISVLTESIAYDVPVMSFQRSCGLSIECDKTSSLSNPYMTVRTSSTCCTTDNCTPATPQLPSSGGAQNGVICRSCLMVSSTSASCYTSETMTCTGAETKCIRFSDVKTSGSRTTNVAVHGCATPTFCNMGSKSVSSPGITITTDLACTDSSIRLQQGILLPAIFGIFLIKVFV